MAAKNIIFRKAVLKDAPALNQIYLEFARSIEHLDPFYKQDYEYWEQEGTADMRKLLRSKDRHFIVMEDNGVIVGFADVRIKERDDIYAIRYTGHIESIYIKPDYRGKGHSKPLIDEAMSWFKEKGMEHLTVGTYFKEEKAKEFWKRMGYREYFVLYTK